jgi:hypothetical protein
MGFGLKLLTIPRRSANASLPTVLRTRQRLQNLSVPTRAEHGRPNRQQSFAHKVLQTQQFALLDSNVQTRRRRFFVRMLVPIVLPDLIIKQHALREIIVQTHPSLPAAFLVNINRMTA